MKKSICHWSFHRLWEQEKWNTDALCEAAKRLGLDGIDFHAGMLQDPATAAQRIKSSLAKTGLALSGFSLSTNFAQEKPEAMALMMKQTREWMRVAVDVGAPVSRIFGGSLRSGTDAQGRKAAGERVVGALKELAEDAEKLKLVLALENHGGLPCRGEEQVEMIERVGSKYLRATVDVGNYMSCGQEGIDGTRLAAPYCAYVHFKDCRKKPDPKMPWGWNAESVVLGQGVVDLAACLKLIKVAGFDGFVALEYEAAQEERTGIAESVKHMTEVMKGY